MGFHKRKSGVPSITWPESVDAALCFGWIDGVRKSIDEHAYTIRFTPRKTRSTWSAVNIKRVGELTKLGLMHAAGAKAFAERLAERSGIYAYEQRDQIVLDRAQERLFRAHAKAWRYFQEQPNWYRKTALWWVMSAKKEETRSKRLLRLIADSEQGRPIAQLDRRPK